MTKPNEIPLFPVAAMTVGPIPAMGYIVIRPDFLSHPLQRPEEAQPGRTYALTPHQAQQLLLQIQSALHHLETAGLQAPEGPKH